MLAIQGGLMGGGRPDVFPSPAWGARYCKPAWRGLDMANYPRAVTLAVVMAAPVKNAQIDGFLFCNRCSFILLAGVGHATMRDGGVNITAD